MTATPDTIDFVTTADGVEHPTLPPLTLPRRSGLAELQSLLSRQRAQGLDVVVSANAVRIEGGRLAITLPEAAILADGVIPAGTTIHLSPTAIFDDQLATRLGIGQRYARKMRADGAVDLIDANANHWLAQETGRFTIRGFYDAATGDGIARAILSGRYETLDNIDQVSAVLRGLQQVCQTNPLLDPASLQWTVDLTERNMRVRVTAPQITATAQALVGGYRDPHAGRFGGQGDQPVVFAGLEFRNSETGSGRWLFVPVVVVQVCSNGMTRTKDARGRRHVGGEKIEGVNSWSIETQRKALELVTAQTADLVSEFLSVEYLERTVREIEAEAGVPVEDAKATVELVAKRHGFTDEERDGIFEMFLLGGTKTAGGIAQAVTAYSHLASPTRAMELDDLALDAMSTAAAAR